MALIPLRLEFTISKLLVLIGKWNLLPPSASRPPDMSSVFSQTFQVELQWSCRAVVWLALPCSPCVWRTVRLDKPEWTPRVGLQLLRVQMYSWWLFETVLVVISIQNNNQNLRGRVYSEFVCPVYSGGPLGPCCGVHRTHYPAHPVSPNRSGSAPVSSPSQPPPTSLHFANSDTHITHLD